MLIKILTELFLGKISHTIRHNLELKCSMRHRQKVKRIRVGIHLGQQSVLFIKP